MAKKTKKDLRKILKNEKEKESNENSMKKIVIFNTFMGIIPLKIYFGGYFYGNFSKTISRND